MSITQKFRVSFLLICGVVAFGGFGYWRVQAEQGVLSRSAARTLKTNVRAVSAASTTGAMKVPVAAPAPPPAMMGCATPSFGAATNFAAGDFPRSVAVGDLNGDGKLDLATANQGSNNVTVLLNNGMGGFTATNFAVGDDPFSVAVGDLNGDGKLDLATANLLDDKVTVLLNNGMGGFTATNFAVGDGPRSVAMGDLNGDGKLDLATANGNNDNVTVLLNDGMGGFTSSTVGVGSRPQSVAVGDLNGDGKLDLATANQGSNNVTVLLNNGMGGFTSSTVGVGDAPFSVAMGDLNGDGKLDLATANFLSANVSVLLNTCNASPCGGTSFDPAVNFGAGSSPFTVTTGDFNGDGRLDLATANHDSDNVSVLLGNGAGGFAAAVNFSAGAGPYSITTGDFNGDGKLDLAVANGSSGNVSVLLGNGAGGFAAAVNFGAGTFPRSVTTGDFNGDGKLDLAVANLFSDNISVLLGDGVGGFAAAVNFGAGTTTRSVTTGDFNRDGKLDLAAANGSSGNVSVLLGDGAGGFAAAVNFSAGDFPASVTTGDFNGDGKLDLATANVLSNNVSVLLGNGAGGFAAAVNFSAGAGPYSITTGDFNGDGKLDLAVTNQILNNISVLLGTGAGGFAAAVNFGVDDFPASVTTGDFNRDGKLDLATANYDSNNVSVLLNNCTANTPPTITPSGIMRTAGAGSSNSQLATVTDAQDVLNTLTIQISGDGGMTYGTTATLNGVTVTLTDGNAGAANINPDAMGQVFADVVASCAAMNATFKLQVTDSGGISDTKDFTVTVNANTLPTLTYPSNPGTTYGTATMVSPLTGPSDDVAVTGLVLQSVTPSNPGGISVNSSGVVSVASTVPFGNYTVTIRISDVCGSKDVSFPLGVAKAPLTVTVNNAWRNQGAANPPFSGTISGLKNGDAITASYSTTAITSSPGGTYLINATLNDPNNRLGNYQVTNTPGTLTVLASCSAAINPPTLPPAALAQTYAAGLTVVALNSAVAGAYTFSHVAGTLPPGLSLVNTAGVFSLQGKPTTPGTYTFTLLATRNAGGCSRAVTYTLTIAPTVVPIAECIVNNGNGTFTARFGYDNSTGGVVTIPVGINNSFSVGAQNRNQPTVFQVGRVTNAFTVTFQSNGSDASSWMLKGPDNVLRGVILSASSPPCP